MSTLQQIMLFSLLTISLLSFLLFLLSTNNLHHQKYHYVALSNSSPPAPKLAYFVSGTNNDGPRIFRLLQAIYHPRNYYLLHLDQLASNRQRDQLAGLVGSVRIFVEVGNVVVVEKAGYVNEEGSSPLSLVLHGAAILLRWKNDWDWFINLAASDYPLIPQDDFLHVLSFLPRELNFIETNTSKEYQMISEVIVDSRLYLQSRGNMFTGDKTRKLPNSFRFFAGSPHLILTQDFLKYAILGWENFPRTLLLYFVNTRFSHKAYFQTLARNSQFSRSVINSNLRITYSSDLYTKSHSKFVRSLDVGKLLSSGVAFAEKFPVDDPMLDMIDAVVLNRGRGVIAPGAWCLGKGWNGRISCSQWDDGDILRPGPGAKRFEKLLIDLIGNASSSSS